MSLLATLWVSACVGHDEGPTPSNADAELVPETQRQSQTVDQSARDTPALRESRERQSLNETVWATEEDAQRYEAVFVKLWDQLRNTPDGMTVLGQLPFDTIRWCRFSPALADVGTTVQSHVIDSSACESQDSQTWSQTMKALVDANVHLTQSEWHHERFKPATGTAPARSVFKIELHLTRRDPLVRYVIKGAMDVTWRPGTSPPQIQAVDTTRLVAQSQAGPKSFGRTVILSSREQPILPIIAYDIDRNGTNDILAPGLNAALLNEGGRFKRHPLFAIPPMRSNHSGRVRAALLVDIDTDGYNDLIIAQERAFPKLYRGNGSLPFTGTGESLPIDLGALKEPSAIAVGDIDADGDLDLLFTQYREPYIGGQVPSPYFDANDGFPSTLLVNRGPSGWRDETKKRGLHNKRHRRTYGASFVDVDQDGDLDLFVTSDYAGIDLYLNDGRGVFSDHSDARVQNRNNFGMSHTFSDFNSDGQLDVYVTGMSSTTARRLESLGLGRKEFPNHQKMRREMGHGNRLYLGSDAGFSTSPFAQSAARSGWSWGSASPDLDNDGTPEIFIGNGHLSGTTATDYCTEFWRHDIYENTSTPSPDLEAFYKESFAERKAQGVSWNGFEHNHLFQKTESGEYQNRAFLYGVAEEADARSVVSADFNQDGRQDVLVSVSPSKDDRRYRLILHQNEMRDTQNWVSFTLPADAPRFWGTQFILNAGPGRQARTYVAGDSYMAQHPPVLHWGLGEYEGMVGLTVRWPGGEWTSTPFTANQSHQLNLPGTTPPGSGTP